MNSRLPGIIALIVLLQFPAACRSDRKPGRSGDRDMQELTEMVLNKRAKASSLAREIGVGANPELIALAGNDDPDVRRIALNCLRETGGTDAAECMTNALSDNNSQVRAAALKGLYKHPDTAVFSKAIAAFDKSEAAYTRQQIALIIGLMGHPEAREALKTRLEKIDDDEVVEGMVTALARLGDPDARIEFVRRLQASEGKIRGRYLDHCEYIHQPWLVKGLEPVLDDETPMVRIGTDGDHPHNEYLRACDLAVDLTVSIAGAKFEFECGGDKNYTPEERAEVRKFIGSYVPKK